MSKGSSNKSCSSTGSICTAPEVAINLRSHFQARLAQLFWGLLSMILPLYKAETRSPMRNVEAIS